MHQYSAVSKVFLGKLNQKQKQIINIGLTTENHCISRRHGLLGQTTKQLLSNFEPQKP